MSLPHAQAAAPCVAFFGHDYSESTVIKRAKAFQRSGLDVLGLMFRRAKFNRAYQPEWRNIDLGTTMDRSYLRRLPKLLGALVRLCRVRKEIARAGFFYARNIDMCALALAARFLAGSKAGVVYEVLDVQRIFTGDRLASRLFRYAERWILKRVQLVVVSSPAFMSRYFTPVQSYRGPWFLLENKFVAREGWSGLRQELLLAPNHGAPRRTKWVIGWFGTLRCPESLDILCRVADALGEKVEIYLRGYPTETGLERFLNRIAGRDNMIYDGEYRSPDDLAEIYGRVHFSWAFDFLDKGSNSDWLLPNRIYEGGFFGSLALAAKGTQTGETIDMQGLGWTFQAPFDEAIIAFLSQLNETEYLQRRRHVLELPTSLFCDEGDTAALCRQALGEGGYATSGE